MRSLVMNCSTRSGKTPQTFVCSGDSSGDGDRPPPPPPSSETPTPPETSPTADAKQETAPEDSTDWLALGDLHRENKDFLQASEAYFKAVEGSDKKTVSRSWLRLLHLPVSESMVASVAERYADLAKRYPTDYRPVTNLGRLFSFHQQPYK